MEDFHFLLSLSPFTFSLATWLKHSFLQCSNQAPPCWANSSSSEVNSCWKRRWAPPRLTACCCTTSAFLLPASLSTKGSSFPGRYCDRLFSEFCGSSIYVCVYCLVMFYIWFFQFLLNCFLCFQTNAGITIKPWRGFSFGITTPTATRKA